MQTIADVMNIEVTVAAGDQPVALGAAMFAATAAGLYRQVEEAQRAMSSGIESVYRPDPGPREAIRSPLQGLPGARLVRGERAHAPVMIRGDGLAAGLARRLKPRGTDPTAIKKRASLERRCLPSRSLGIRGEMKSSYGELKEQAWQANLEIPRRGLAIYTFGNVSAFDAERAVFAIKPSGVTYESLTAC